jgi:hypothetical protein
MVHGSLVAASSGLLILAGSVVAADLSPLVPRTWEGVNYACKVYYDDASWPTESAWQKLNQTVGGGLLVDIPPGAACYNKFQGPLGTIDTFNAAKCDDATANFADEQWT